MLLLLEQLGTVPPVAPPTAYAIVPGPQCLSIALQAISSLRASGVSVLMHAAGRESWGNMKSQFKRADASGARYALIFGDDEVAQGVVACKDLRDPQAAQRTLSLAAVNGWAAELVNA